MYSCWFKVSFRQTFCFVAGIQKSAMVGIIICNLINNVCVLLYGGHRVG